MAEVELGGVKFRGGKIAIILTAISSFGGAMWGGFEFYKDYMDMRDKIESYSAPDLSGFDKRLAVLKSDMSSIYENVDSKIIEINSLAGDLPKKIDNNENLLNDLKSLL